MRIFRPEFCLGVAVLLSFLSLTFLLLSTAPNSSREAAWTTGIGRVHEAKALDPDAQVQASAAFLNLEARLEAMERRQQAQQGYAYPAPPAYPPSFSASQVQLDGLVQQMTNAFARAGPEKAAPPRQDFWWPESTTSTPEWQGQLKEIREAVERLSHQTDDRFSSLMKPMSKAKGLSSLEGHACRSPPCSRDAKSCKVNGNCCSDLMFEMLVDFSQFLIRKNVTFMLSEGTLLGAVRDQDIIPYTADLDIFVPREGWEKAMQINEEPPSSKSYHFMVDPDQPHCARLCAVWQGFPVNRAPFDEHFEWDTEKVGNDLAYYMDIYDEEMDFAQATQHLMYPSSTAVIRNVSFPAPREQEIYVEARYGPSWRTPDHQARELAEKYPTLQEAKVWSANMLILRAAQQDVHMGYRMLERATVDYHNGDIVIRGLGQERPHALASKLALEGFEVADGKVAGGKITVYPPAHGEHEIVDYVLYWAKEDISWGDEIIMKRIDSGMDSLEDAKKEKEEKDEGWGFQEPTARPLGRIWRCKGIKDPFKECTRGVPLQVSIPHDIKVPEDATHLAATSENEAGEHSGLTTVHLKGEESFEGAGFAVKFLMGFLQGLEAKCSPTGNEFEKDVWVDVVARMVLRTQQGMKEALSMLASWLEPIVQMLQDCEAEESKRRLVLALQRLRTGVMDYKPSEALQVDGVSIFAAVNGAISASRRGSLVAFGRDLGGLVRQLGEEESTSRGLKLRPMTAE